MGKIIKQILSNETINDKDYLVFSDSIDWERFKKNPVMLWDHNWSLVIGNVVNIRREGADWLGDLVFDLATELSKEKSDQYDKGSVRGVSLSGKIYYTEKNGIKFVDRFIVYEISLVPIPSNEDAVAIREGDTPALAVSFSAIESEEIVEFSARNNQLITNFINKMEEDKKVNEHENVQSVAEESFGAEAPASVKRAEGNDSHSIVEAIKEGFRSILGKNANVGESPTPEVLAAKEDEEDKEVEDEEKKRKSDKSEDRQAKKEVDEEDDEDEDDEDFKAEKVKKDKAGCAKFSASKPQPKFFDEQKFLNKKQTIKTNMERKSVHEYFRSAEGREKFASVGSFMQNKEGLSESQMRNDSRFELFREFAHFAANDKGFTSFMSEVKFDVDGKYSGTAQDALNNLESFASGINSMNFITTNPDLAKIDWLTMIYRLLLPDDSWADRVQRVGAEDKAGVIWVNSAIAPKVYMGKRAPLNVAGSTYDDTPVGIIMNLFALSNIIWQQSNTDLLAYDDVSLGTSEAMRVLQTKIHNYYLQKFAEAASIVIPTSGSSFNTSNAFPANPAAAGNGKAITPADLTALQTGFINQNYIMETFGAEMVMPAAFMQQLQSDPLLASLLTKNAGALRPNFGEYSGFSFRPRSISPILDTASTQVVDPQLYMDGIINNDGTIPSYTPPTIASTAYGAALGFIPSECIIGLGRTNVHMVTDPSNYGWRMSMDIRTGAGAARVGGKGIGLIYTAAIA